MARWDEIRVVVPRGLVKGASALFMELGAVGVQEDVVPGDRRVFRQPWDTGPAPRAPARALLRGWWDEGAVPAELPARLEALGVRAQVERGLVEEQDWAESWKENFRRLVISERLAVAPPWEAQPGDVVIEPGLAFGTGEHPTTAAILAAIDRLAEPGGSVLDVGCGSGVLALAGARLGMRATGVDIDPLAVRAAREAAAANALEAHFDDTPVERIEGSYDLVVANLFAEVLVALAPHLIRLTGRHLALAGILSDRADRVVEAYASLRLIARRDDGEWTALEYAR